jgi:KaiC/GvpD/RAD55 family RecA-like ATPase
VDGITDLLRAEGDAQRVQDYLYALTQHLATDGVSSLLTCETSFRAGGRAALITDQLYFSAASDCIIVLDIHPGDRLRRTVCVLKVRNSAHDLTVKEMEITASGLRVG